MRLIDATNGYAPRTTSVAGIKTQQIAPLLWIPAMMMVLIDKAISFFFFFEYGLGLKIEDWGIFDDYGSNQMLELVFPDLPFCTCCLVSRHIPCLYGQVKTQEAGQALASSRVQLAQPGPNSQLPLIGFLCAIQPHCFSWRDRESMLEGSVIQLGHICLSTARDWYPLQCGADTSTKHNLNSNTIYSCVVGAGSVLNDKCTLSELFSFPSLGFLSIS